MTATAIQQVTTEDVKQGILALIRENNAELKAFLGEVSAKITDTPTPQNGRIKAQKSKKATFTVVEGARVPYSEMPFWKENPHLQEQILAFREKKHLPAEGDFATAMKKVQEVFSDLDVTDAEWLLQIKD